MSNPTKERIWMVFWILFAIAMLHACLNPTGSSDPQDDDCVEIMMPTGYECA